MRLMSPTQTTSYIDLIDREDGLETGDPVEGHTTWLIRPLTSTEEGALQDDMMDLGRTSFTAGDNGETAKANIAMAIRPSKNKRNRLHLGIVGWKDLYDEDGKEIVFEAEPVEIAGEQFDCAPGAVLDRLPQALMTRLERKIKDLSAVEPGMGN